MREELKAWADGVALRGPDAPENDGMIKYLKDHPQVALDALRAAIDAVRKV